MSDVSTQAEYDLAVEDAGGNPVLVLFTSPTWCAPCRQFEPHWDKLRETLPNHKLIRVIMGESPEDTANHWATAQYGIRGVPQVYSFRGIEVPTIVKSRTVLAILRELGA